jgi:hypothetical protein
MGGLKSVSLCETRAERGLEHGHAQVNVAQNIQVILDKAEEVLRGCQSGRLEKKAVLFLKAVLLLDRDSYATDVEVRVAEVAQEEAARICALLVPSLSDPDGEVAGAVCNLLYNLLRKPMLTRDLHQVSMHENGIRASLELVKPTERMHSATKAVSDVALGPLFLSLRNQAPCRYGTVAAMASGAIHNLLNFAGSEVLDTALDAGAVQALGALAVESHDPRCHHSAVLALRSIAVGCSYHRVDELRAAPPALLPVLSPIILDRRPPQDDELF